MLAKLSDLRKHKGNDTGATQEHKGNDIGILNLTEIYGCAKIYMY